MKNAFLNGNVAEEVYMKISPGFGTQSTRNQVYKLKISLFGLNQPPRAWFKRFTRVVKLHGYVQCQTDHTLFVKKSTKGERSILIMYIDDIIVTGDYLEEMADLKKILVREFEIKDLGNFRYFLEMEVSRSSSGISVTQRKYVLDLLKECGMLGCKPADTPMEVLSKYRKEEKGPPVKKGQYQRLVGRLTYLSHTCSDIAFYVRVCQSIHEQSKGRTYGDVVQDSEILKTNSRKRYVFQEGDQS